jgi:hypothetical protein
MLDSFDLWGHSGCMKKTGTKSSIKAAHAEGRTAWPILTDVSFMTRTVT